MIFKRQCARVCVDPTMSSTPITYDAAFTLFTCHFDPVVRARLLPTVKHERRSVFDAYERQYRVQLCGETAREHAFAQFVEISELYPAYSTVLVRFGVFSPPGRAIVHVSTVEEMRDLMHRNFPRGEVHGRDADGDDAPCAKRARVL